MAEYWKKIGYTPKPHELSKSSLSNKNLPEDKLSPPKEICVKQPQPETIVIEDDWE